MPIAVWRVGFRGKIKIYEIRVEGEFGWLVDHLERVRQVGAKSNHSYLVFVRSSIRHSGLTYLYQSSLPCRVFWSTGPTVLMAQVVLLLPRLLQSKVVVSPDRIVSEQLDSEFQYPSTSMRITEKLFNLRTSLLSQCGIASAEYVALAVFTSTEDEKRADGYSAKYQPRETVGQDLTCSIDWLRNDGLSVILLGFGDSGRARIPREIPRLTDFSRVGGLPEIALASGCKYFWSDFVGAQWLREPFKRPVLVTNQDEAWFQKSHKVTSAFLKNFLCTPLRFQRKEGSVLTIREALENGSCFEAVARGELVLIRNSCEELRDANEEMLRRLDGSWKDNEDHVIMRNRLIEIYATFPQFHVPPIASSFLARHPYLLD